MAGQVTIYGIKNCDTMKKARDWLDSHHAGYAFHDYKAAGINPDVLESWVQQLGWEILLNRAGTTFKKLPEEQKAGLDAAKAIRLMAEQPSMIKRPVLVRGGDVLRDIPSDILVGFKPERYEAFFS